MGDYIHKPVLVYGGFEAVDSAGSILREIITRLAPSRIMAVHDNLALQDIFRMANDNCFLLIPGSGGKDGGSIDQRWQAYIHAWKREIQESGSHVQWVELELGEVEKDVIKQTKMEFREEFYEEQDP